MPLRCYAISFWLLCLRQRRGAHSSDELRADTPHAVTVGCFEWAFVHSLLRYSMIAAEFAHLASHAFSNGALHQTTQTRQHIDRWVHLPVVQLAVNVNLHDSSEAAHYTTASMSACRVTCPEPRANRQLEGRLKNRPSSSQTGQKH